ncbi:ASKHA domain-containing protein [uncultured Anaerovibrio sp.]|uniref:ASKHA domain-containing protein n=1 Tax=uncultured Anaerovibrio sp. TaxID=361586 RepID=UPI002630A685|nr:ASKHA domain-containing protein [uncultured Anaerovibrio sp.]
MSKFQIVFQPSGRRGEVEEGKTILQAAQSLGVGIEANCGGAMVCGKCKIIPEFGTFDKLGLSSAEEHISALSTVEEKILTAEEIQKGVRLACCVHIKGDLVVSVPKKSQSAKQVVLEAGSSRQIAIKPAVKAYFLRLTPPTLEDPMDDRQRLLAALQKATGLTDVRLDYPVLCNLSQVLRENNWEVTVTVREDKQEIVRVRGGDYSRKLGIAIDIGTTTLAAYLCDLDTGELLEKASRMNSQIGYGEDILSRVSYATSNPDGLQTLHDIIINDVNELATELTAGIGGTPEDVDEMVLVYNTVMHHLALKLYPGYVGRSPFAPVAAHALDIKARDLGININPAGWVHSLPIEAGFVGADNMAVVIAEEPYNSDKIKLIIDIGTNGEIDLGNQDRLLCTSCATGPALEGAQIKFGMRAAPGAIEGVKIDKETLEPSYKVIGNDTWYPELEVTGALGICGSGIIDVFAALYEAGIVGKSGRINNKLTTPRIRRDENGKWEYVLAYAKETGIGQDIVVTQADIRAIQLAKAAIYVGAEYLLNKYGIDHVDEVILAGAFGSYINKRSALVMGMFPDCDLDNIHAVGNAAGDGARIALLNIDKRHEADEIARKVEFVETAAEPDFQEHFMEAIAIPHAKAKFPHVKVQ